MGGCRNPTTIRQSNFRPVNTQSLGTTVHVSRGSSVALLRVWHYSFGMPPKRKKFKGCSPNVLQYIESCGNEDDIGNLLSSNLAASARLAAENESQAQNEKTSRTHEFRLVTLEKFSQQNGDDAVLFDPSKRPFLAATIQKYMGKFVSLMLLYLYDVGELLC